MIPLWVRIGSYVAVAILSFVLGLRFGRGCATFDIDTFDLQARIICDLCERLAERDDDVDA